MNELSYVDCQSVSGGMAFSLLGVLIGVIGQAEAINDFCAGFFDGAGGIK